MSCLWLFGSLLKTEHMGKPWNNESAEKWWACGRHVRQKELATLRARRCAARRQRSCVRPKNLRDSRSFGTEPQTVCKPCKPRNSLVALWGCTLEHVQPPPHPRHRRVRGHEGHEVHPPSNRPRGRRARAGAPPGSTRASRGARTTRRTSWSPCGTYVIGLVGRAAHAVPSGR